MFATGCDRIASIYHLHVETQLFRVDLNLGLLCSQYLTTAIRPAHLYFQIVSQSTKPAPENHNLKSGFLPFVSQYLSNNTINPAELEDIRYDLNHQIVQSTIRN